MKQKLLLFYLLGLLLHVAISGSVKAQSSQTLIEGTVLDEDQQELPGVNVIATQKDTGKDYGTITDVDGVFSIPVEETGLYEITVSYVGFQSLSQDVTVKANQ